MSLRHQMFLQTLRELNALTTDQQYAYQARLLTKLLAHAAQEVPAQTTRLAPVAATGEINLDYWYAIRPLAIGEMEADLNAFTAKTVPTGAEAMDPSASRPQSRLALIASDCVFELGLERAGAAFALPLLDLSNIPAALTHPDKWNSALRKARRVTDPVDPLIANQSYNLRASRSAALAIDPAPDLAGLWLDTPALTAEQRCELEARFQIPPVCIWSQPDLGTLAVETAPGLLRFELGTHAIEVVDPHGRAAGFGTEGDVLVTCLYDYAIPVIRQHTGIRARLMDHHTLALTAIY